MTPSAVSRHIACNRCRMRKVKCDGRRPWCKRCSGTGAELQCSYETKRGREHSEPPLLPSVDSKYVAALLQTLDENYASAAVLLDAESFDNADVTTYPSQDNSKLNDIQTWTAPDDSTLTSSLELDTMFANDITISPEICDPVDQFNGDAIMGGLVYTDQLVSASTVPAPVPFPRDCLLKIYDCYRVATDSSCPLIDQDEFMTIMISAETSQDIYALRNAIYAHGSVICPDLTLWASVGLVVTPGQKPDDFFIQQAKRHLELAETHEKSTICSLATVQTTILVALYELRHAQFGRSWVTVSRAVWLVQALRRGRVGSPVILQRQGSNNKSLIPTASTDTKEERTAMWAVLTLSCFLYAGGGPNIMDTVTQNEIGMYLPQDDTTIEEHLKLENILRGSRPRQLSKKQGMSIAIMLCNRTIHHLKMMSHSDALNHTHYNFWTQHCRIDEATRYLAQSTSTENMSDPDDYNPDKDFSDIILILILKAVSICLHEALLERAEVDLSVKGSTKWARQALSSEAIVLQNSLDIAQLVQSTTEVEGVKNSIFFPWAIYVAIQSLNRHQGRIASSAFSASSLATPDSSSARRSSDSTSLTTASTSVDDIRLDISASSSLQETPLYNFITTESNDATCGATPLDFNLSSSISNVGSIRNSDEDHFADVLADAMVRDMLNVLRSTLADLGPASPLVQFFSDESETEMQENMWNSNKQTVGLVDFTKAALS